MVMVHFGMFDVLVFLLATMLIISVRRGPLCNVQNAEAGCMQRSFMILSALSMPGNAPVAGRLSIQSLLPIELGTWLHSKIDLRRDDFWGISL